MTDQITTGTAEPGTAAACVEFWDVAAEKAWFNPSSAKAVRTAFTKVMSIEDGWERLDVRTLDEEALFGRFRRLRRNEYSDSSLRVYRSRFHQAVTTYVARIDDDPEWKSHGPAAREGLVTKSTKPKTKAAPTTDPQPGQPSPDTDAAASEPTPTAMNGSGRTVRAIDHKFPLRDDFDAVVSLPRDLTAEEAEWLGAFIKTLARPTPQG